MFGTGEGFTADAIIAGFLSADRIEAGSITTSKLASDVGSSIDISDNVTITGGVPKVATSTVVIDGSGIDMQTGGTFTIESENFEIDSEGNVTMTGEVNAASGDIGGWTIATGDLHSGTETGQNPTYVALNSDSDVAYAIWAGNANGANAPFSVTKTGSLVAKDGEVGGWDIGANQLSSGTTTNFVAMNSDTTTEYAIWAGNATAGSAPFSVKRNGQVKASSGTVGGWTLGATELHSGSGSTRVALSSSGTYAIWAGSETSSSAPFSVTNAGAVKAVSGNVGGWSLANNSLTSGTGSTYVALNSDASSTYAIWAGNATAGSAPFRVERDGSVVATDGSIGGWSMGSGILSSGSGTGYVAMDSNTTDTFALWAGNETAANAPFRVMRDGTVILTKLQALDSHGDPTTVDLRNYQFWRLRYHTIQYASPSADGKTLTIRYDDGTDVNFNKAGGVVDHLSGSVGMPSESGDDWVATGSGIATFEDDSTQESVPISINVTLPYGAGMIAGRKAAEIIGQPTIDTITLDETETGSSDHYVDMGYQTYSTPDSAKTKHNVKITIDATDVYEAGQNSVDVVKGSWSNNGITFTPSAGTGDSASVHLSWNGEWGSGANANIYTATIKDGSANAIVGTINASNRYSAGSPKSLGNLTLDEEDTGTAVGKTVTVTKNDDTTVDLPITIDASAVYAAGIGAVGIAKSGWSRGSATFTPSTTGETTQSVDLAQGSTTWNGNVATIGILDGSSSTNFSVTADATTLVEAVDITGGWGGNTFTASTVGQAVPHTTSTSIELASSGWDTDPSSGGFNSTTVSAIADRDTSQVVATISVNANSRYVAGQNSVNVSKGSWSGNSITFSPSVGTGDSASVHLVWGGSWGSGETANIYTATITDGGATAITGTINASNRYSAGSPKSLGGVTLDEEDTGSAVGKTVTVTRNDNTTVDLPITIDASAVYQAGIGAVGVARTSWSRGSVTFTPSTTGESTQSISLTQGATSWDGNEATVGVLDGSTSTGLSVRVNATTLVDGVGITEGWSGNTYTVTTTGQTTPKTASTSIEVTSSSWDLETNKCTVYAVADRTDTVASLEINAQGRYNAGMEAATAGSLGSATIALTDAQTGTTTFTPGITYKTTSTGATKTIYPSITVNATSVYNKGKTDYGFVNSCTLTEGAYAADYSSKTVTVVATTPAGGDTGWEEDYDVDTSGAYQAGIGAVGVVKGTWGSGSISFTPSVNGEVSQDITLSQGATTWDGNTATVTVRDGSTATGCTVTVNASGRYQAGADSVTISGDWSGNTYTATTGGQTTAKTASTYIEVTSGSWDTDTNTCVVSAVADRSTTVSSLTINATSRFNAGKEAATLDSGSLSDIALAAGQVSGSRATTLTYTTTSGGASKAREMSVNVNASAAINYAVANNSLYSASLSGITLTAAQQTGNRSTTLTYTQASGASSKTKSLSINIDASAVYTKGYNDAYGLFVRTAVDCCGTSHRVPIGLDGPHTIVDEDGYVWKNMYRCSNWQDLYEKKTLYYYNMQED